MNDPSFLEAMRQMRQQQEAQRSSNSLSGLLARPQPLGNTLLSSIPRRNVFISYHHGDDAEVKAFLLKWSVQEKVFTAKGLGLRFADDIINSDNAEYVMSRIRQLYLYDTSVTIVLLGKCTHSRRYVDWEIKSSLRQEKNGLPNGVMGIILPSLGSSAILPPRLAENWTNNHVNCYARFWIAPRSAAELRGWIEDAFNARTSRAHLIQNSPDMMRYNATCQTCGIVHPAT